MHDLVFVLAVRFRKINQTLDDDQNRLKKKVLINYTFVYIHLIIKRSKHILNNCIRMTIDITFLSFEEKSKIISPWNMFFYAILPVPTRCLHAFLPSP